MNKPTVKLSFTQLQRNVIGRCISLVLMDYNIHPADIAGDELAMHRHRYCLSLAEIAFLHNWNENVPGHRSVTLGHSRIIDLFHCIQEVNAFLATEQERFASRELVMLLFTAIVNGPIKSNP